MDVEEYVGRLKETRKGKPEEVREALDVYIGLWEEVVRRGTVSARDDVSSALSKLDDEGGLVEAAAAAAL